MQELRLVAVSEDGTYVVLASAGRGTRFTLPIDERLRAAVRGQFSRLGQYEIEVESPLRPKEIQARIRAGETAEQIAEISGLPIERVRWFEGPVLQERQYIAQQAQRAAVRRAGDDGPGPSLGDMVTERLGRRRIDPEEAQWDSWKLEDGTWSVRITYLSDGAESSGTWVFDPRRRHVTPMDDEALRLSTDDYREPEPSPANVTPFVPRLQQARSADPGPRPAAEPPRGFARPAPLGQPGRPEAAPPQGEPARRPDPLPDRPAAQAPPWGEQPRADRRPPQPGPWDEQPPSVHPVQPGERPAAWAEPQRPPAPWTQQPGPDRAGPWTQRPEDTRPAERPPGPYAPTGPYAGAPAPAADPFAGTPAPDTTASGRPAPGGSEARRAAEQAGPLGDPADRSEAAAAPGGAATPFGEPAAPPGGAEEAVTPSAAAPEAAAVSAGADDADAPARSAAAPAATEAASATEEAADGAADSAAPEARTEEPAAEAAGRPAAEQKPARAAAQRAPDRPARKTPAKAPAREQQPADEPAAEEARPAASGDTPAPAAARRGRKSARNRRASVPSWDEIMFGAKKET
ncbi:septation protein SepH [Allonocardiopsis opalescens]|uniref:DUF3071 domain-containing protein n=1 Tax=Allonocardiopsis opalescens TaxID=1144618 RepID=A0A2T0PU61_9ACTN|nr:septation protein SepH [Allonocardiopsis opalescens]PRX92442.1 Protein of unknown function (DUF3071) [Allonocardiopsis opalescens]